MSQLEKLIQTRKEILELCKSMKIKLRHEFEAAKFPDDLKKLTDFSHRYDIWELMEDLNKEFLFDLESLNKTNEMKKP